MKNILLFFLAATLFFSACQQNTESAEQITKLKQELTTQADLLKTTQTELAAFQKTNKKTLVHTVYFKLKSNSTKKENIELVKEINKLENIKVLKNLEVGTFQDLGDARALSDYGLVMQMEFASVEDYQTYQAHDIHLTSKDAVKKYLAGPPATYDYWTE